ncbi:Rop guanine nucleotide exchange factor 1 [Dionaea muscipula]
MSGFRDYMGSVSSEDEGYDQQSERYGSYNLSADISESESSCSFSCRRFDDADGLSCSVSPSPLGCRPVVGNCSFAAPPPLVVLPIIGGRDVFWDHRTRKPDPDLSEMEMMKERFAKLLLGEDMSGGGKGVCTALAISNAITNLAATVFGELWRLEPLRPQKKTMWCREMEWLLSVSHWIVELVPSIQELPGGGTFEVMATRPRSDLYVNLPALKKLDGMLLSVLDGFKETEFWYVDRGVISAAEADDHRVYSTGRPSVRQEDKWWLPMPKVPANGLSEEVRKKLQQCRECTNQILKAAVAINGSVLAEMEIPAAYIESLPKNGKECLGDMIYRYITAEQFSSVWLLDSLDLSTEHQTLEVANRVEAAVHVWKLKDQKRCGSGSKSKRSSWGGKVKGLVTVQEKNQVLAHRAEDVGQAILESYSRVMESLAFNIMARIDDLLFADDSTKISASVDLKSLFSRGGGFRNLPAQKRISPSPFSVQQTPYTSPFATPSYCFSPASSGSPGRCRRPCLSSSRTNIRGAAEELKLEKQNAGEFERIWSHPGNLSSRKTGVPPERD